MAETTTPLVITSATGGRSEEVRSTASRLVHPVAYYVPKGSHRLIHRSAWKDNSANFVRTVFYGVRPRSSDYLADAPCLAKDYTSSVRRRDEIRGRLSSCDRPVRGATIPDPAARRALIDRILSGVEAWESRWGPLPDTHLPEGLDWLLDEYAARMDATLPFFHPRYAGQMLKAPHPVAVAGYLAAMIVNPNNHA